MRKITAGLLTSLDGVVSHQPLAFTGRNSEPLQGDLVAAATALRHQAPRP